MEVELKANEEYRIEVLENQKLKVMVVHGLAEMRGQELLNDKWYIFSDLKSAIFTFNGCKLRIDGECELKYKAASNIPFIFEYFLNNKEKNKTVIVIGKGRTFFCSSLINYFIRIHKTVDFIELDPSTSNIFPGCVSFLHVNTFVDCAENFRLNNPICLFYGSTSINNTDLFQLQTSSLNELSENFPEKGNFKVILCPNVDEEDLNLIIKVFRAVEILVVGDERLFHKRNFIVPKIFVENHAYIQGNVISKSIHRYFNGYNEFTPCSYVIKQDWPVFRIGEQFSAPESALPLGSTRRIGKTDPCKVELIENSVLAISEADSEDKIATSPVMGFIICLDEKKFRILATQPKLPKSKYLIQGDIKYLDF